MPEDQVEYVDLPIYHNELAQALNFTPLDLQANRTGRLSDSQRSTQFRTMTRSGALAAVFLLLAVGCVVLAFAIGVTTGLGVLVLLLAPASLAFVALFAWYGVPLWRDIDASAVSSIEGMVRSGEREKLILTGKGPGVPIFAYYWIVDDSQRFWVTGKAYAVLTPARHRLYFMPLSRRIVAAEPVSSTSTN